MIKKLPKSVCDKIAAGEVVERPLSVVKELVENAVDAGANAVSVSIEGGGIKKITVSDNGCGIASGEVSLAFEKHATSKIASEQDLFLITTQGFRGEALSSIASVSIAEMTTKRKEEDLGTKIRISCGRFIDIQPAGLPDGTTVTVSRLFCNVPARLKFLKSESKEAAYISDLMSRYILAFPEISFHYTSQQKTIYHSPGNGNPLDAIFCVYGGSLMDNIEYVSYEANGIKAQGYVSRPGAVMNNRQKGSVFVNRRFVRSTALADIIKKAYGQTLVKGEHPFYLLNITLPPGATDVNVHPNKLQVRFLDITAVEYVIKEAINTACRRIHGGVTMEIDARPEKKSVSVEMRAPSEVLQTAFFSGFSHFALNERACANESDKPVYEYTRREQSGLSDAASRQGLNYRLIGAFLAAYVLVEQGDNLLIIDQHAAHERLLYDKFLSLKSGGSQTLLRPHVLRVSHEQKNLIDENAKLLSSLGFEIEPFGALEYKLSAVPAIGGFADIENTLYDAVEEIGKNRGDAVLMREAVIRAACRRAVKAGDSLPKDALLKLVEAFLETDVMPTCPHGRPVITIITKKQLEKSFKRVL